MHVSCLVPEVLELLEELVKAYSCLELTHYLYLWGMYCVQSLCEVVSLSWALVVARPLLGLSCILFKMCNLWVNFEASMWSQGKCLRILHLLLSAATAGIMRRKIIAGGKTHVVIALMLEPTAWLSALSLGIYPIGIDQTLVQCSSAPQNLIWCFLCAWGVGIPCKNSQLNVPPQSCSARKIFYKS